MQLRSLLKTKRAGLVVKLERQAGEDERALFDAAQLRDQESPCLRINLDVVPLRPSPPGVAACRAHRGRALAPRAQGQRAPHCFRAPPRRQAARLAYDEHVRG
jgi:hypothetical protein